MNTGYVKVFRSLTKKGYYKDSEYVHLWVHLLMAATYQSKEFLFNNKLHQLQPGQFITGRNALANDTGIDRNKVERILKCLQNEQQIEQQTTNKFRIITILNWNEYQSGEQQTEQPVSSKRATSEQPVSTINKEKKDKKEKKVYIAHGSLSNVKLTEEEMARLKSDFGIGDTDAAIEYLSKYKQEKDYKTKDDNLTLRRWVFKAVARERGNGNGSYQSRGSSGGYGRRDRGADELPPEAAAELAARIKRINDKV